MAGFVFQLAENHQIEKMSTLDKQFNNPPLRQAAER
jgi:hypothetical protein